MTSKKRQYTSKYISRQYSSQKYKLPQVSINNYTRKKVAKNDYDYRHQANKGSQQKKRSRADGTSYRCTRSNISQDGAVSDVALERDVKTAVPYKSKTRTKSKQMAETDHKIESAESGDTLNLTMSPLDRCKSWVASIIPRAILTYGDILKSSAKYTHRYVSRKSYSSRTGISKKSTVPTRDSGYTAKTDHEFVPSRSTAPKRKHISRPRKSQNPNGCETAAKTHEYREPSRPTKRKDSYNISGNSIKRIEGQDPNETEYVDAQTTCHHTSDSANCTTCLHDERLDDSTKAAVRNSSNGYDQIQDGHEHKHEEYYDSELFDNPGSLPPTEEKDAAFETGTTLHQSDGKKVNYTRHESTIKRKFASDLKKTFYNQQTQRPVSSKRRTSTRVADVTVYEREISPIRRSQSSIRSTPHEPVEITVPPRKPRYRQDSNVSKSKKSQPKNSSKNKRPSKEYASPIQLFEPHTDTSTRAHQTSYRKRDRDPDELSDLYGSLYTDYDRPSRKRSKYDRTVAYPEDISTEDQAQLTGTLPPEQDVKIPTEFYDDEPDSDVIEIYDEYNSQDDVYEDYCEKSSIAEVIQSTFCH